MEEEKKSCEISKTKPGTCNKNEISKNQTKQRRSNVTEKKIYTTLLSCCNDTECPVGRNPVCLEKDQSDRRKINYEMVQQTLMECLNLTRNPNNDCTKRMSHTVLQYFTYVVFKRIKKNLSRKQNKRLAKKLQDSVMYFDEKLYCAFSLGNLFCGCFKKESNTIESISENSTNPILHPKKSEECPEKEDNVNSLIVSDSSQETESNCPSELNTKDTFLCNLPNAPPFILRMNKTNKESPLNSETDVETLNNENTSANEFSGFEMPSFSSNRKSSGYTEIPDLDMFIDNNCPSLDDQEFREFVTKSISFVENEIYRKESKGFCVSSPTICMTGLTGFTNNPFCGEETDSRGPGKNIKSYPNTDDILKKNSYHIHSKIPRMLHPGKCKIHNKMKNGQTPGGSVGCSANKSQTSTGSKTCSAKCAGKTEPPTSPFVKITVSTTCPSATNNSKPRGSTGSGKISTPTSNTKTATSQSSVGDCVKGLKKDPGCYCGSEAVEVKPCPVRLKEDCECVEEEEEEQESEDDNASMCYCPPGEQPLLMKKSNVECDCANRTKCDDDALIEPPKEKPNVFWALTKVSLLKDGSKNFEIIDVSPVPPGYYLMPNVDNLVLVGPQPKPKVDPSKNCSCK